MFDLEHAISEWKKTLRKRRAIQDGDRVELESYLREKIEDLVAEGLSEEEAFRRAAALLPRRQPPGRGIRPGAFAAGNSSRGAPVLAGSRLELLEDRLAENPPG